MTSSIISTSSFRDGILVLVLVTLMVRAAVVASDCKPYGCDCCLHENSVVPVQQLQVLLLKQQLPQLRRENDDED